jgi:hypothetical protein
VEVDIDATIPDVNFAGLAIIDWEAWRPLWAWNFDALSIYQVCGTMLEQRQGIAIWADVRPLPTLKIHLPLIYSFHSTLQHICQHASINLTRARHPDWNSSQIEAQV